MKLEGLKDIVKKHHLSTYGDIQAEVILYGGTIEEAEKIYHETTKGKK